MVAARALVAHGPRGRALNWRRWAWEALKYALVLLVLVLTLFPIYWVVATAIKHETDFLASPPLFVFAPTLDSFAQALKDPEFGTYLVNSLVVAVGATVVSVAAASLAAHALARYAFPGAKWVALGILSARLVPGATMVIPYFVLFRALHLTDTLAGLVLAYTGFSLPFACWLMYGYFLEVPSDVEDSARIDGCSDFDVFWRVSLPLTLPGLGATAILVFLGAWNKFLFAVVLSGRTSKTLPVYLAGFISERTTFWGGLFAVATVMIVPALLLTLLVQRSLVRGLTAGAVKG